MKISLRSIGLGLLVLGAFGVGHWVAAQGVPPSPQKKQTPKATDHAYALEEYTSFLAYLHDAKLANVEQRFIDFENASLVSQECANMGIVAHALVDLRCGDTNRAIKLLETDLAGAAFGFASIYPELPERLRAQASLQALKDVRYYATNYQFVTRDQ